MSKMAVKQKGWFEVHYASGRTEELHFKKSDSKEYKDLLRDLTWAKETGAVKNFIPKYKQT